MLFSWRCLSAHSSICIFNSRLRRDDCVTPASGGTRASGACDDDDDDVVDDVVVDDDDCRYSSVCN